MSTILQVLFFFWRLSLGLVVGPRLSTPFVSQNLTEGCASHSPGRILAYADTICPYSQIRIFRTTPSGLPFSTSHV